MTYRPDYAVGNLLFFGGGGGAVGSKGKHHWQRSWKLDLTTDFWLCLGITSAWPLACVFVAIYGRIMAKEISQWCSWYCCGRGRGYGWWNVCLMSGGCGREDGGWRRKYHIHPSMSVAILCGKTVKAKNRNVSRVMRRQRKSSQQVKCVLHWRQPWECRPPMETNWPWSPFFDRVHDGSKHD